MLHCVIMEDRLTGIFTINISLSYYLGPPDICLSAVSEQKLPRELPPE